MKNKRELVQYLTVGFLMTVVNISSYFMLVEYADLDYRGATILSWVLSALIAFAANNYYLFNSGATSRSGTMREMASLIFLGILSLGMDLSLMILLVEQLKTDDLLAKILVNIAVIVFNYGLRKWIIFANKADTAQFSAKAYSPVLLLAGLVGVISFFILSPVALNGFYFLAAAGDMKEQYVHFFNLFHDLIRSGEWPFWAWEYGLGGSFWNEFGYYQLGDVFIWPLLLLPKAWFPYSFLPMAILKIILIAIGIYLLLKECGVKTRIAMIAGLAGCFSLYYFEHLYTHYFFVNAAVYFPFVLWGLERFRAGKSPVPMCLILFLVFINNFYFAFMVTVGLFLYSLFRYFGEEEARTFKGFFHLHFRLAGYYLLSLGASMVIFLPSAIGFFGSSVFNRPDQQHFPSFLGIGELVEKLISQGGVSFLPLIALPLLFINGRKVMRYGIMGLMLLALVIFQDLNRIVGGLSQPHEFRAFFIINTLLIVLAAVAFQHADFTKAKNRLALIFSSALISFWLWRNPFTYYADMLALTPLLFAVLYLLMIHTKGKRASFLMGSMTIILAIYSVVAPYSMTKDLAAKTEGRESGFVHKGIWGVLPVMTEEGYQKYYNHPLVRDAVAKIDDDTELYRILMVNRELLGNNSAMSYGYNSFFTYQSLLRWDLQSFELDFLAQSGSRRLNTLQGFNRNTSLHTLLGNKYHLSLEGKESPLYGYETVYEEGPLVIQKNRFHLPIGFLYESAMTETAFEQVDFLQRDEWMFQNAVVPDDVLEGDKILHNEKSSIEVVGGLENSYFDDKSTITETEEGLIVESDEPIVLTMPVKDHALGEMAVFADIEPYTKNEGITIEAMNDLGAKYVFEKNMKWKQYQVYQYHYMDTTNKVLFRMGQDQDTSEIQLVIQPGKFLVKDIRVASASYEAYEETARKHQQNALKDIKYGQNFIKGTYEAGKDSVLFLSIPYSPGWKVTIDGEKADTFKVHSAFTGAVAPQGSHSVSIEFIPPGFKLGLAVSLASLSCALFLYFVRRKRSRSAAEEFSDQSAPLDK